MFVGSSNFFFDGASGFFSPTHRGLALGHVLLTRLSSCVVQYTRGLILDFMVIEIQSKIDGTKEGFHG